MVFDVSLEMQSDSKNDVSVQDDEINELVHSTLFLNSMNLPSLCKTALSTQRFVRPGRSRSQIV